MFSVHWQKARNNAKPPDTAELQLKAIFSVLNPTFGVLTRFRSKRDCLLKLNMLVKSASTVSRELYLEKRVYILLSVQNLSWCCLPSAYGVK